MRIGGVIIKPRARRRRTIAIKCFTDRDLQVVHVDEEYSFLRLIHKEIVLWKDGRQLLLGDVSRLDLEAMAQNADKMIAGGTISGVAINPKMGSWFLRIRFRTFLLTWLHCNGEEKQMIIRRYAKDKRTKPELTTIRSRCWFFNEYKTRQDKRTPGPSLNQIAKARFHLVWLAFFYI